MTNYNKIDIPVKQGMKTLRQMLPYVSEFKIAITTVLFLLFISSSMSIVMGFAFGFFVDEIPGDSAETSQFFDKALKIALIFILFTGLVRYAQTYLLERIAIRIIANIRSDVFNNIVDQELAFFDHQTSGELQTRIVSDTNVFGQFVSSQIPVVLAASVRLLGGLAGAFYISLDLTLTVLVFLPIVFSPFLIVSPWMRKVSKTVQMAIADIGKFSGETFRSFKIMQAYNKKDEEKKRFRHLVWELVACSMRKVKLELSVITLINSTAMMGVAILLWSGAKEIHDSSMTIGQFISFTYFVFLIVNATGKIVSLISSVNFAIGATEKIVGYLALEKCSWPSHVSEFHSNGRIEFRHVQFSYPSRPDIVVLKGINLVVEAGTHVVIVGPSGAGKSSLLEILLRFYNVTQGTILVDGTDINDFDVSKLRSFIGFVPQKESLLSGTIYENIAYGTENADRDSVRLAAEAVGLHGFIEQLPMGYDSDLGEVGNRLSGGQKQRISLARALIRNPQILLLDEANSALDVESDRYISGSIRQWAKTHNATVVTIAHRLSTARLADKIIVMQNGHIVAQGSHDALIASCSVYRNYTFTDSQSAKNIETITA